MDVLSINIALIQILSKETDKLLRHPNNTEYLPILRSNFPGNKKLMYLYN